MNQNRHSKHQKMTAVREAGFCMIDAGMYLDTHPCQGNGLFQPLPADVQRSRLRLRKTLRTVIFNRY